jgi:hypothetical protein
MPAVRGREPTSSATLLPSKAGVAPSEISIEVSHGMAQSSSSIAIPAAACIACGTSSSRSSTGTSGPEHRAGRDAEEERVADLSGCAGHRDFHSSTVCRVRRWSAIPQPTG